MAEHPDHLRDGDRGSPRYQQNITAQQGSTLYIAQGRDLGARSGSGLERVRALSAAAAADSDIVAWRDGQSVVRLSDGAYVARSVQGRLLKRLAKPSVTAVVGEAGCGKSALLWHLYDRLARVGYDPMLVPATALLDGTAVDEVVAALREPADRGPVMLLVDTLDLLLHDLVALEMVNRVLRAAAESRVPTLMTSRPMEARMLKLAEEDDGADSDQGGGRILKVSLTEYDRRERTAAIATYARLFYSPQQVPAVAQVLESAQLRGLPLREVCRNPLALRLLFELYAPDRIPPEDVDSIGLFDQFWRRRVADDRRGASGAQPGHRAADLSRVTEAVGLVLLSSGSIVWLRCG